MPIDPKLYQSIRRLYVEGHSQRHIAQVLGVSRDSVAKYCSGENLPGQRRSSPKQATPLRMLVEPLIQDCLDRNREAHRKQKMKASDIWRYLVEEKGVQIAPSTVRQLVAELRCSKPEAFIPLEFESGDVMQVDWGDAYAYLAGVSTPVSIFCAVLPYSGALFAGMFPNKSMESFLLGHQLAFEFFGGIPRRCMYDNLKTAVATGSGLSAVKQERFALFEAHYAFEAVFCRVASGWEKGSVENSVKTIRTLILTPAPTAQDFQELQELAVNRCLNYLQTHKIRDHQRPVREDFVVEKASLLPFPKSPMEIGQVVPALVHSDCTVRFEKTRYSVPWSAVGKKVTLRATPFSIFIYHEGQLLAEHKRTYIAGNHQYVPEHYLELLERRPRSQADAKPLKSGVWPQEFKVFRSLYCGDELNQELVKLLRLSEVVGKQRLLIALATANASPPPTYTSVLFHLEQAGVAINAIDTIAVSQVDLHSYDRLFEGGRDRDDHNGTD
jgi:transposase